MGANTNYSKGKIYLIKNINDNKVIDVGSTTLKYLYPILQKKTNDQIDIELYELFPCNTKRQLVKRENQVRNLFLISL